MKAFPYQHKNPTSGLTTDSEGMDLRDWFAGLVLQGLYHQGSNIEEQLARRAYSQADWMMKIRKEVTDEQPSSL
jgi:hypothetical protein